MDGWLCGAPTLVVGSRLEGLCKFNSVFSPCYMLPRSTSSTLITRRFNDRLSGTVVASFVRAVSLHRVFLNIIYSCVCGFNNWLI